MIMRIGDEMQRRRAPTRQEFHVSNPKLTCFGLNEMDREMVKRHTLRGRLCGHVTGDVKIVQYERHRVQGQL